ncbi:MAG TPA: outer membrane beta-barrel protein [Anaerolineae bacterium]
MALAGVARADDAPAAAPAGPTALSAPAMSSSLSANANPISTDVGFFGKIYFSGQVTGLGTWQNNSVPGNNDQGKADFSNAQIEIQKTDGVVQFYVQAGTYTFPSLGAPYVSSGRLTDETYKVVPVAFLKLAPTAEFNIMIGKLPTLIGAEYTFTFENLNVERGLLWNQETAVSRGVQANYAKGPLTVSASWNDGFYSDHYSTGSGLISYVISPKDTVAFVAAGNFKKTATSRFVTPIAQNNGTIWNLIWTHTEGPWVINPYLQYTTTPKITAFGLPSSASTFGGAVLAKYTVSPTFNIAGRAEYIGSSGSQVALLYGTKSSAWSLTLTPTWQVKTLFIRGEVSYTKIDSMGVGAGFGKLGNKTDQTRAMIETGVLF